jgi:hypothetical protein
MPSVYFHFINEYKNKYEKHYDQIYYPQPQHFKQIKPLVDGIEGFDGITLDEWAARLKVYFESNEEWVIGCKHNLSAFIKHFHRFIPKRIKKQKEPSEVMIHCTECHKDHPATYQCWVDCEPQKARE